MKKKILLVILTLLIFSSITYLIISLNKNKFIWDKTYNLEGNQPYDFSIFYTLLRKQSTNKIKIINLDFKETIQKAISDSSERKYTYICISRYPVLPNEEIDLLLKFVNKGNQAFLFSESIADTLLQLMTGNEYNTDALKSSYSDSVIYTFEHPDFQNNRTYKYSYYYKNKIKPDYKVFFNNDFYYSKPNFIPLAKEEKHPSNMVYLYHKTDSGKIFFHLDLLPFTNYYMIQEQGLEYVNKITQHMEPSNILWDIGKRREETQSFSFISKSKSPIDFILERRELATAWYLLLFVSTLFMLFGVRRLQNPIPVISYRKNTSLNFVETISSIYKHKSAYKEIAHLKMEHFLWFLRNKIGVSTTRLNKATSKEVSRKTGIEEKVIQSIFEHYENRIQGNLNVQEEDLILFNSKITNFHNKLKNEQRRIQQLRKTK